MLNGALDEFDLDQVVGLLASARKSGALVVEAGNRTGRIAFDDGRLIGCDVWGCATLAEALTELRRLETGRFKFVTGEVPTEVLGDYDSATVIAESDQLLAEWRELEGTIPSRFTPLRPVETLPDGTACLTQSEWRLLTGVGRRATPVEVARRLGMSTLAGLRALCHLVERGLLEVDPSDAADHLDDADRFQLLREIGVVKPAKVGAEPAEAGPVASTGNARQAKIVAAARRWV